MIILLYTCVALQAKSPIDVLKTGKEVNLI